MSDIVLYHVPPSFYSQIARMVLCELDGQDVRRMPFKECLSILKRKAQQPKKMVFEVPSKEVAAKQVAAAQAKAADPQVDWRCTCRTACHCKIGQLH